MSSETIIIAIAVGGLLIVLVVGRLLLRVALRIAIVGVAVLVLILLAVGGWWYLSSPAPEERPGAKTVETRHSGHKSSP